MKIPHSALDRTPEGYKEMVEILVNRANQVGGFLSIPMAELIEQLEPSDETLTYISSLITLLEVGTYKHHNYVLIDKEKFNKALDIEKSSIYDVLYRVLDKEDTISICIGDHKLCIYKEDNKYKCSIDKSLDNYVVTASLSSDSLEELLTWVSATFTQ